MARQCADGSSQSLLDRTFAQRNAGVVGTDAGRIGDPTQFGAQLLTHLFSMDARTQT